MKTYELLNEQGEFFAFEVGNSGLGRKGVCRVVETIPGAKVVRRPKFLSWFLSSVLIMSSFNDSHSPVSPLASQDLCSLIHHDICPLNHLPPNFTSGTAIDIDHFADNNN